MKKTKNSVFHLNPSRLKGSFLVAKFMFFLMTGGSVQAFGNGNYADGKNVPVEMLQQQERRVTGKVVDASGEPVIGANVVVKGTATGTITDMDGNFVLDHVLPNAVIQISYIGYKSQDIA